MKPDQPGIEGGAQRRARRPRTTQPRRARCSRAQRSRFSEPPVSDASLRASLAGQERSLRPERGPRLSPENHKCLQIAAKPRFKESRRFKSPSLHHPVPQFLYFSENRSKFAHFRCRSTLVSLSEPDIKDFNYKGFRVARSRVEDLSQSAHRLHREGAQGRAARLRTPRLGRRTEARVSCSS